MCDVVVTPADIQLRFGFVKYHNYEDAENCIRGFHYLGYEVSFARVSAAGITLTAARAC